jgi:hypothetical protein
MPRSSSASSHTELTSTVILARNRQPPARANQTQILQLLIHHGLDPRHWDDALFCDAIYWKSLDAFKLLISAVFSLTFGVGKPSQTFKKKPISSTRTF